MDTEENNLIVDNMGLAYDLAYKYYNKIQHTIELNELQSVAFLGLTKAGNSFNKELNFAFSTYAYNCIRNELIKYISNNINNTGQSLSTEIGDNLELSDVIADEINLEQYLIDKVCIFQLQQSIKLLPSPYKDILIYKLKGNTFNEIADLVNISVSQVNQYYHRGINMLRYRLKDWRDI